MRFSLLIHPTIAFAPTDTAGGASIEPVAEIVTFRLNANADPQAFAEAAKNMTPFLRATGAARTRTLCVDAEGLWTDHIIWTDLASAKSAAEQIMAEPAAMPFMQMIDPETVTMRHAPIRFQLQME